MMPKPAPSLSPVPVGPCKVLFVKRSLWLSSTPPSRNSPPPSPPLFALPRKLTLFESKVLPLELSGLGGEQHMNKPRPPPLPALPVVLLTRFERNRLALNTAGPLVKTTAPPPLLLAL